jgi:GntR family transcriptional regulator, transcriptional repressor for pyruvate dehydrogenase complex
MNMNDTFGVDAWDQAAAPVSGGSLSQRVAQVLLQKIQGNELAAGSRLPSENAMAQHFGVSRTVIREAMATLRAEGLVETRQGSGAFVRRPGESGGSQMDTLTQESVQSLLNLIEVRRGFEAETAALAAVRRTPRQLADIRRALRGIEEAVGAGQDGVEEDVQFHLSIAKATGNPYWVRFGEVFAREIRAAIRVTRANEARQGDFAQQVLTEHERILAAIAAGDAAAARTAAGNHMEHAARRVTTADRNFWRAEGGELARHLAKPLAASGPERRGPARAGPGKRRRKHS